MNDRQAAELDQQIRDKEAELETMRSLHMSAASTYGSELCAGDMLGKEDNLAEEIVALRARRAQL